MRETSAVAEVLAGFIEIRKIPFKNGRLFGDLFNEWTVADSNRRPLQCECSALPAELTALVNKYKNINKERLLAYLASLNYSNQLASLFN